MAFFPLFFELADREVLAVGAGVVGTRRIRMMTEFGAAVTVVAKEPSGEVEELALKGKVRLFRMDYREYRDSCSREKREQAGFFLVLASTGDKEADELAAEDGRRDGAFVNVAGDRTASDFYFPGIAKEGPVTAGITAGGRDHALARDMTAKIRECLIKSVREDGRQSDTHRKQGECSGCNSVGTYHRTD